MSTRFLLKFIDDISEVCDPSKESSRLGGPLLHLSCRDVDVEWISDLLEISLHHVNTLFDLVIFLHVPSVLLGLLMEDHQPLPVRGVRVEILLPCEEEVRVPVRQTRSGQQTSWRFPPPGLPSDGSAVGDEVSDGLHDVPAVVPPGEPGQDTELCGHQT